MQRLSGIPILGQENEKGYADVLSSELDIKSLEPENRAGENGEADDLLDLMDSTGV